MHQERIRPLNAVAFMQELPSHRFIQAGFALAEFKHESNGLAAAFQVEAVVLWKTGQSGIEHFVDRAIETACQLLLDDLLLLGLEFDRHTFNLVLSNESCNRGQIPNSTIKSDLCSLL